MESKKEMCGINVTYAETLKSLRSIQGSIVHADLAITSLEAQCEQIIAQRDELLAALKGMLEAFDHGTENEEWAKPFINAAHDAIAKCEVQS